MTDHYNAFIVVLEENTRDDNAQETLTALRQIKGVLSVEPKVSGLDDHIAYEKARRELSGRLWEALEKR